MKGWLKLLVLAAVPVLAVTMVANPALAADKGSQLIFQSNMAHQSFISVINANDSRAVTVLVQYYNDEMTRVAWYLRVIPADTNLLVDPFNHAIPGTAKQDDDGEDIAGSETNISEVLGSLPAMTNDDDGPGINTGHFVIAVTAVGANTVDDPDTTDSEANTAATVNILFPTFLAADLHGTDNIDNGGALSLDGMGLDPTEFEATEAVPDDNTTKNVGDLSISNAQPVAFNHLTGHFTEALTSTGAGGADQTASWGGTPVVRPAVTNTANAATISADYTTLNGLNHVDGTASGRLAEKDAGGTEVNALPDTFMVSGYTNQGGNMSDAGGKIQNGDRDHRALTGGAFVLPALHGGGEMAQQIMLLMSVSENWGDPGSYELVPAMTGINVLLMDGQGDPLDSVAISDPNAGVVGGGGTDPAADSATTSIIVKGIQVMTDADLSKCTGTAISGPWSLASLTSLIPEATAGGDKFAGLDAELDPMMNLSPGWIKFARSNLSCEVSYGDGDAAATETFETPDGVPPVDDRTYTGGTLIVEEQSAATRTFVTTGRALLKFITSDSTFAASWTLKSPVADTTGEDGDASN